LATAPPRPGAHRGHGLLVEETRMERVRALALYDKPLATNPEVQRKRCFEMSYTYVSSLRPKATTRKKPVAAKKRPGN
jgi:hypothetical protein